MSCFVGLRVLKGPSREEFCKLASTTRRWYVAVFHPVYLSLKNKDLSLLLACLKFQMKCPNLQKQALLTIHSICEKREDNVDLFRQLGGVAFVYSLYKSSIVHSDVKETALFTLGTLAEANVYCKNSLCRKETFLDLAGCLMKEDFTLAQKRVSVYLLFVLVANNNFSLGKKNSHMSKKSLKKNLYFCRTTFPLSTTGATMKLAGATQTYQLWASVSSALCGCVNNPQNVFTLLHLSLFCVQISLSRTDIFQPICSFIAMTVANNPFVQENFFASGGLETLTLALVRLASTADTSLLSCQLSVIISKTLSACITDNCTLPFTVHNLYFFYGVVSHLLSLLASPHLDPQDRLPVLLTLGHLTETSGETHQSQLIQCGGLPLIITLLTEDTCEEVRKAATFVLQACKQASKSKHYRYYSVFKSVYLCSLCPVGCVLPFEEVTSRTFATLQSSCPHSCDMHKALQEATEQFRIRHCNLYLRKEHHDNTVERTDPERAEPQRCSENWKGKRRRKDFSCEEVHYLLSGVEKFGFSWNSILWSYPFQPGRTNVDLANKYRRLMVMRKP
uniref:Telomere repeat binding bouquet formation protein 1 n=1 Tax=Stegastes partitus TaxID=144197 RepID=A0A3B5BH17_9TELE